MTSWNQEYKRATLTSNITIFPPVIEPGGNTMTSTVDSMRNVVETDSCPRSHRSILASPAKFVLRHPDVLPNKNDSEAFTTRQTTIKNIPPPPPPTTTTTQPHFWQYPEYHTFASRIASFQEWPKYLKGPNRKDLARAGFIYTRIGDYVTCFCCGMTLKNWEPLDDAYQEHIRWSRHCQYAQMVTDGKLWTREKETILKKWKSGVFFWCVFIYFCMFPSNVCSSRIRNKWSRTLMVTIELTSEMSSKKKIMIIIKFVTNECCVFLEYQSIKVFKIF